MSSCCGSCNKENRKQRGSHFIWSWPGLGKDGFSSSILDKNDIHSPKIWHEWSLHHARLIDWRISWNSKYGTLPSMPSSRFQNTIAGVSDKKSLPSFLISRVIAVPFKNSHATGRNSRTLWRDLPKEWKEEQEKWTPSKLIKRLRGATKLSDLPAHHAWGVFFRSRHEEHDQAEAAFVQSPVIADA
jgi:hypothetical protein